MNEFPLLIWIIILLYGLLPITELTEILCSSEPVSAFCGSSVVLQCYLEPQLDATHNTVKWRQQSDVVHVYQDGKDNPGGQGKTFVGRTYLPPEELRRGNLSLQLSNLNLTDSGKYECSFHDGSEEKSCHVNLTVVESAVIGLPEGVTAELGQDVILPCHLEPPFDVTTLLVEWRWNNTIVHVYRSRKDTQDHQNNKFKNRTSLFHNKMIHGNISLKLTNVTEEDEGIYTCIIPTFNCQVKRGNISLKVVPVKKKNKNTGDADSSDLVIGLVIAVIILGVLGVLVAFVVRCLRGEHARQDPPEPPAANPPDEGERNEMLPIQGHDDQDVRHRRQQENDDGMEPLNEPN